MRLGRCLMTRSSGRRSGVAEDVAAEERVRRICDPEPRRCDREPDRPIILESCLTRVFLPNARAVEPQSRAAYERLGLNARQIDTVARATPKRDYYFQSARGNRLFELGLGEVTLAFAGVSQAEDLKRLDAVQARANDNGFAHGLAPRPAAQLGRRLDRRREGSPGRTPKCRDGGSGMKRLRTLFAGTVFATSLAITGPVSADLPVIDISNLKQSILTAAHTLEEVNNQITQIQQFVQMLQNEARNLLSLPFSALQQITSAIDQVNSLMQQAQSPLMMSRASTSSFSSSSRRTAAMSLRRNSSRMHGRAGRRVSILSSTRCKFRAASCLIFRPMRRRSRRSSVRARALPAHCRGSSRPINCSRCNPASLAAPRRCSLQIRGRRPPRQCAAPRSRKQRAPSGSGSGVPV